MSHTTPVDLLLSKLENVKPTGGGYSARCPAHDDDQASLSITQGDDGRALVKCHADCTVDAVCAAVGLKLSDLFTRSTSTETGQSRRRQEYRRHDNDKPTGKSFATAAEAVAELERRHGPRSKQWTYDDAEVEPVGVMVRWDLAAGGKEFRPVSRHGDKWFIGGMAAPRPLYSLPELPEAKRVYVCEGEKAADAARSIGLVATTSAHGAASPEQTDWSDLAGKEAVVLPDKDPAGRKYAETVVSILLRQSPTTVVKVVDLPSLPEHGDIVEWIAAQSDKAEPAELRRRIESLADAADPLRPEQTIQTANRYEPYPVDVLPEPLRGFVRAAPGNRLRRLLHRIAVVGGLRCCHRQYSALDVEARLVRGGNSLGGSCGRERHAENTRVPACTPCLA